MTIIIIFFNTTHSVRGLQPIGTCVQVLVSKTLLALMRLHSPVTTQYLNTPYKWQQLQVFKA